MLTWNWKNKVGEIKWKGGETINLYEGNALMIGIYENNKNETYQISAFFLDKEHAKNCLGLNKGTDNIFESMIEKVIFYKEKISKNEIELAKLFVQAKISIEFI